MAAKDWSNHEVELIVADYFSMLSDELKGLPINKSFHRKSLVPLLNERSESSIEFKHQNISAALAEMGLPFINGYKPRYNFQREKLYLFIGRQVDMMKNFNYLLTEFSDSVPQPSNEPEFSSWVVSPPEIVPNDINPTKPIRPIKINYLEKEQNNRDLGIKGEELVFRFEKLSLVYAGKQALAESVEWISKDLGDGAGFDILSRNFNGTDKYIEVKTTKLAKESPFFFTSNEYRFSKENSSNYYLYRVFNYSTKPFLFTLNGSFDDFCKIEPTNFRGSFR